MRVLGSSGLRFLFFVFWRLRRFRDVVVCEVAETESDGIYHLCATWMDRALVFLGFLGITLR